MIISIFQHRLLHIFADIDLQKCAPPGDGYQPVGRIVHDVTDVWANSVGTIVIDRDGHLWVDLEEDDVPFAYLARDITSFRRAAELGCAAGKLWFLPRPQQWRYVEADELFMSWLRANDPRTIEGEGSFWNELRSPDF